MRWHDHPESSTDERAILESLAAHLDDCGYRTLTARNGREGIEVFAREGADLVLVDLRMPEMDGLDVLARIRQTSRKRPPSWSRAPESSKTGRRTPSRSMGLRAQTDRGFFGSQPRRNQLPGQGAPRARE